MLVFSSQRIVHALALPCMMNFAYGASSRCNSKYVNVTPSMSVQVHSNQRKVTGSKCSSMQDNVAQHKSAQVYECQLKSMQDNESQKKLKEIQHKSLPGKVICPCKSTCLCNMPIQVNAICLCKSTQYAYASQRNMPMQVNVICLCKPK